MGEFRMPSLGADMDEGTLLEWLVAPGDAVERGDIVAVVDTEKSDIEVEVFESGVVRDLLVEEGTKVPVGTPLALIDAGDGAAAPPPPTPVAAEPVTTTARPEPVAVSTPERVRDENWTLSSPLARRLAAERGVDLAGVTGSGPGGAVVAADVPTGPPAASAGPGAAAEVATGDRATSMRDAIARSMARSKREIPHYYLQTTVDLDVALRWLRAQNEDRPVTERVLPAALLLAATARAAAQHPGLNGTWEDGHRPASGVHLGVAIALRRGGLVAPGIADADRLSLVELMAALRDLTARARAGRVRGSEWTGPTITVTSLGDLGVDAVYGVIHPPQLAMVGFGAIHDEVVAVEGEPAVRPVVVASLAADHRASDGMQGAAFLARIAQLLQTPEALAAPPDPTRPGDGATP